MIRGAPAISSGSGKAAEGNWADWPGSSAVIAVSRPPTLPSAPPNPGSAVIAAGLSLGGLITTCGSPDNATGWVSTLDVSGRPGTVR